MKAFYRKNKFAFFITAVTVVKLLLGGLFSSDYQNGLFIPFVMDFIEHGGNPYQRSVALGIGNAFPYSTVMLLMECIGGILIRILHISSTAGINLFFKVPSLIMDYVGLYYLCRLFPTKKRYVAVFYFASPIILYSVYMHGQLDLIPTVLLLVSVYNISSKHKWRYFVGGGFLILALQSKLHIMAAVPIIVIYIFRREGLERAVLFEIFVIIGSMIVALPFFSQGFCTMVLFNLEQDVLFDIAIDFVAVKLYIPIFAILIIYLVTFTVNIINRELFISFCGVTFAVFLALCPPMPGWYVWIVPYVTVFFASIDLEKYKNITIYAILNFLYLIYFFFLYSKNMVDLYFLEHDLSFIKIHDARLTNLFFTLMSGMLVYIVLCMYQLGIMSNSLYRRKGIPFVLGIAGDSGVGKSTLINILERCLGRRNLIYIEGDGDHRWERGDRHWTEVTHLNPKANYLYRQAAHIQCLRNGGSIYRIEYDHNTGKFLESDKIKPKKYVILCGLHSLYLPQIRKNLDLKIYMDVDEKLRRYWKIQRDTISRGYSKETIIRQIEDRMPDAERYIYPQKQYADMIIRYYDAQLTDCLVDGHNVKLSLCVTISAAIDVEPLSAELSAYGLEVGFDYSEDLQMQTINISADDLEAMEIPVEEIANRLIPQLEEVTQEALDYGSAKDGIVVLFALLLISNKMLGAIR